MNAASRAARSIPWLVVAGVLVAALSLRGPIVAPTPVLRDIEADLGLGSATVALLTTAPVLMFALLTPLAALLIRRSGPELALLFSLSGVLAGTGVRALPGFEWMLAGTVVIGAAITIGNVVVPVIVRRDVPPERVSVVTAAYTAMLNAGSLLTSLLTAPLAAVVGWPVALLLWCVLTLAGIVLWSGFLLRERRRSAADAALDDVPPPVPGDLDPRTLTGPVPAVGAATGSSFLRRPVTWLLMATFACQTFVYYGLTTWLPGLTEDLLGLERTSAGALASLFQGVAIFGAFLIPVLARIAPGWVPFVTVAACWLVLSTGLLLAPTLTPLWLVIGAIAHAGGFVVVFTLMVQVSRTDTEAAGMSALVQGGGYLLGGLSGPVLGALHEATGGWSAGLTACVIATVLYGAVLTAAFLAARRDAR